MGQNSALAWPDGDPEPAPARSLLRRLLEQDLRDPPGQRGKARAGAEVFRALPGPLPPDLGDDAARPSGHDRDAPCCPFSVTSVRGGRRGWLPILPGWLEHYNGARAHGSLDAQPPLSRFPGGNNLMLVHN